MNFFSGILQRSKVNAPVSLSDPLVEEIGLGVGSGLFESGGAGACGGGKEGEACGSVSDKAKAISM